MPSYGEGLVSAALPASEATATSAAPSAASEATTTAPSAPATLGPRAGFADVKGSLLEYLPLQSGERCHSLGLGGHFHKAKASGLSAVSVLHDSYGLNFAESLEFMTQVIFG